MRSYITTIGLIWSGVLLMSGCITAGGAIRAGQPTETQPDQQANQAEAAEQAEVNPTTIPDPEVDPAGVEAANIISVQVSGNPGAYNFSVGIESPDLGCDQYADWWEVLSQEGDLLYRRILLHSHAGEQPFVRSGGPVDISSEQLVWVRAHMNTTGYGGIMFQGSVETGFQAADPGPNFATEVAELSPLPNGCDF